jgi:hypothetical protein
MPYLVPSEEDMPETRRLALDAFLTARRLSDAERRLKGFSPSDRSPEVREAIEERDLAAADWHRARDRLDHFLEESGGKKPRDWPEGVSSTLKGIGAMTRWGLDLIIAWPDVMTRLEEDVKSLPGGAIDSKGSPGSSDELHETDRKFLRALGRLGAFDRQSKTTRGQVASDRLEDIGHVDSQHFENCVAKLKRLRLIETARGLHGGVWLTREGKDRIPS